MGKQRPYVATTRQVWALYEAVPEGVRPAILLGAHAGLRLAEAAAIRVEDVDFATGVVSPSIQWVDEPLKSDASRTSIPIPKEMAHLLAEAIQLGEGRFLANDQWGNPAGPWTIERAVRAWRVAAGLPDDFRFHDLRHYFASLLIASGLDVKVVQARLRHPSAKTTLDTYGHLWADRDDTSRAAVAAVYKERNMSHYDVDLWVDTFEPDTDGILRVRLTREEKRASIGDVVCIGDGELVSFACVEGIEGSPSTGVALLKLLMGPDGGSSAPMLADDGWCDVLDE